MSKNFGKIFSAKSGSAKCCVPDNPNAENAVCDANANAGRLKLVRLVVGGMYPIYIIYHPIYITRGAPNPYAQDELCLLLLTLALAYPSIA